MANTKITSRVLADDAVLTANITDSNITVAKMAANSVDSDQYVDGSIDAVHLAADIITGAKIADNAIDSEHYTDGSIDLAHLSANSIDSDQYVDGSIDTAHIADDQVTADKLAHDINLVGNPTTTTQSGSNSTTRIATTAFVQQELTTLIGGAPSTLNDLNELAAAINDDANYNSTLTTALATKLPLAGGTMTGNLLFNDGVSIRNTSGNNLEIGAMVGDGSNTIIKSAGDTVFQYYNGSAWVENVRFDDGNVGIGTGASPATELEVKAASGYAELRLQGASGSSGTVEFYNASSKTGDLYFDTSNNFIVRPAGTEKMRVTGNNLFLNGGTDARIQLGSGGAGANTVGNDTVHVRGDGDHLKLMSAANGGLYYEENGTARFSIASGGAATLGGTLGVTGVVTANAGVVVDTITIDGSTITASSSLTLDLGGNLTINVDGTVVSLSDDSVNFGQLFNSGSGNFNIYSPTSNQDMIFRGNDGGSGIVALTLDMSNAGKATFNAGVRLSGLNGGTGLALDMAGSGDYVIKEHTVDDIMSFQGQVFHNFSSGNFGIGDSNPDFRLVVKGAAATNSNIFKIEDSGNTKMASMEQDSSGNGRWIVCDTDGNADILLHTAGNSYFNGGNVGIGIASPTTYLDVRAPSGVTTPNVAYFKSDQHGLGVYVNIGSTFSEIRSNNNSYPLVLNASSGGNVGIGTTSPAQKLSVHGNVNFNTTSGDGNEARHLFAVGGAADPGTYSIYDGAQNVKVKLHANGATDFGGGSVSVYAGTLYVSGEQASFSAGSHNGHSIGINGQSVSSRAATNTQTHRSFYNPNGGVGTITTNGSATAYNTSSDYRLKENVATDWDGTTLLKQLKPSKFNFKADSDTTVQGFLAHEVSSIVPEAISGTKDAVYTAEEAADGEGTEGQPKYQGIDQSKLVPLLVKTIQELEARITAGGL